MGKSVCLWHCTCWTGATVCTSHHLAPQHFELREGDNDRLSRSAASSANLGINSCNSFQYFNIYVLSAGTCPAEPHMVDTSVPSPRARATGLAQAATVGNVPLTQIHPKFQTDAACHTPNFISKPATHLNITIFLKIFRYNMPTMTMKTPNVRLSYRRASACCGAVGSIATRRPSLALRNHDQKQISHLFSQKSKRCGVEALDCELARVTNFQARRPPLRSRRSQVCRVKHSIAPGADDEDDDQNEKEKYESHPLETPEPGKMGQVDQKDEITKNTGALPRRTGEYLTGIEQCRRYLSDIGMNDEEIESMIRKFNVTKHMTWDHRHPLAPNKRELWDPRVCEFPCCTEYPTDIIDDEYEALSFRNTRVILLAHMEPKARGLGSSTGMYMLPLGGGFLVDNVIQNLQKAGISENMYATTQYSSYHLNKRLHQHYSYGPRGDPAVKVLASHQTRDNKDWIVSDVDCLQKNLELIMEEEQSSGLTPACEFIVCTGSSVHDINYRSLMAFHRSRGSDLTVCAVPVPKAQMEADMHVDFSNRLIACKDPTVNCVDSSMGRSLKNIGIFVFNTGTLQALLEEMDGDDDFVAKAFAKKMKVNVYKHSQYWHGIETVKDYHDTMLDILRGGIREGHHVSLQNDLPSPVFMGCNVLNHSFIGGGTYFSGNCSIENSYIGNNLILGNGARVMNSVLMHCPYRISEQKSFHQGMTCTSHMFDQEDALFTTVIGDDVVLEHCVVDENVHVGSGSIITNVNNVKEGGREGSFFIDDGIVYLLKDCSLPEKTVI